MSMYVHITVYTYMYVYNCMYDMYSAFVTLTTKYLQNDMYT